MNALWFVWPWSAATCGLTNLQWLHRDTKVCPASLNQLSSWDVTIYLEPGTVLENFHEGSADIQWWATTISLRIPIQSIWRAQPGVFSPIPYCLSPSPPCEHLSTWTHPPFSTGHTRRRHLCSWREPPSSLFLQTLRGSGAFPGAQVISQTLLFILSSLSRSAWTLLENTTLCSPDRTSAFGDLSPGNWILMWGSSFGHGKASQSSPSHILPEKPAVEQLGMPSWQDKQRGSPNPSFAREPGQWHAAVWTTTPEKLLAPTVSEKTDELPVSMSMGVPHP